MNEQRWRRYLEAIKQDKVEAHPPNDDIIRLIFTRYLPVEGYPNILEVAAGAGVDMAYLKNLGYTVTGIDINPDNIKYGKEKLGLTILNMDMHTLQFPDNLFDGILSIQTFEHSLSPYIVASEMCRVLRPKGRLLLDTCDANDDAMWQPWHPSLLYPRQIIKLFDIIGFDLVRDLSRRHRTQIIFEKRG
jgi:ubiquinone/menaquinone biosynthesis C-methylase UbiE